MPFWSLFLVERIINFAVLDETFAADPPGYKKGVEGALAAGAGLEVPVGVTAYRLLGSCPTSGR